jgi:hypothetical protein
VSSALANFSFGVPLLAENHIDFFSPPVFSPPITQILSPPIVPMPVDQGLDPSNSYHAASDFHLM